MDDENREIHFSTENDRDSELHHVSMEDARVKIQSNLGRIAGNMAQSLNMASNMVKIMSPALANFAKIAQELSPTMKPVLDTVRQLTESFSKAIVQWKIPTITEERKQELVSNHKKWGEYGWTMPPEAPFNCFNELPEDIRTANSLMKEFCSKQDMAKLFDVLRDQNLKKEDLEDAILCYNNRQYKPCALVLFGIIDAKLIRKQKKGTKYRPSGSKAVKRLREEFENGDNEKMFFTMLHCVNLFACLETLFANADDFKTEPDTINRNFVAHGMTRRSVRQRDCNQLFLALYNLMLFFDFTS